MKRTFLILGTLLVLQGIFAETPNWPIEAVVDRGEAVAVELGLVVRP